VWIISDSMMTRMIADVSLAEHRKKIIDSLELLVNVCKRELAIEDSIAQTYKKGFEDFKVELAKKTTEVGEVKKELLVCEKSRTLWTVIGTAGGVIVGGVLVGILK
jgi:hypothetical protein